MIMRTPSSPQRLGVTIKLVLDIDEATARSFWSTPPSSIVIGGKEFGAEDFRIAAGPAEVEPSRVWFRLEPVLDDVDVFLQGDE